MAFLVWAKEGMNSRVNAYSEIITDHDYHDYLRSKISHTFAKQKFKPL
jgi:hypothetical protein